MELSDENHCWQMLRLLVKVVYFAQALEFTSGSRSTMATFAPSLRNLVFWGDHSVGRPRLFATRINSVSNWLGRWNDNMTFDQCQKLISSDGDKKLQIKSKNNGDNLWTIMPPIPPAPPVTIMPCPAKRPLRTKLHWDFLKYIYLSPG